MKIAPQRTVRYYSLRFKRLRGDPSFLAFGVAIGVFVGITPTIPLHTVLALMLAFILRASKIAALLATVLVSNPLTFFMQYYLSWRIGSWLTSSDLSWEKIATVVGYITADPGFRESLAALSELSREAILVLLLGGFVMALPLALLGYILSFYFFAAVQKKRREKRLLK